jgi:hypothetical protein
MCQIPKVWPYRWWWLYRRFCSMCWLSANRLTNHFILKCLVKEKICVWAFRCMVDIYVHKTDPFHVDHMEIDLVHNHHHRCFEILFSNVVPWHLEPLAQFRILSVFWDYVRMILLTAHCLFISQTLRFDKHHIEPYLGHNHHQRYIKILCTSVARHDFLDPPFVLLIKITLWDFVGYVWLEIN